MSWKNVLKATIEEMEKDGLDLLEQVIVLVLGGVLGGQAYTIARGGYSLWIELILYLMILAVGIFVLGSIHFMVSYQRVLKEE